MRDGRQEGKMEGGSRKGGSRREGGREGEGMREVCQHRCLTRDGRGPIRREERRGDRCGGVVFRGCTKYLEIMNYALPHILAHLP